MKRSRGVVVNMPVCHTGDRGFKSRPDRHYFFNRQLNIHASIDQLDRSFDYGSKG